MPIPPDTRTPGDTGHITDHHDIADELTALVAADAAEAARATSAEALALPLSKFSVAADGQGNNGEIIIANPVVNSMAAGVQASGILSGGTTGSPQVIAGAVNYSLIDGGYDDVIESVSVGVLKIGGAHNRIFGNSATHSGIAWGSFNEIHQGSYAAIGGGTQNTAASDNAAIGGGTTNTIPASSSSATIGGGTTNTAYGNSSAVAGGSGNVAAANGAAVAGGVSGRNFGLDGTVGGGSGCQIGDGLVVTDGAMTASSPNLACHTSTPFASPFTAGSTVVVLGAGAQPSHTVTGGTPARAAPLVTTISSITSTGDAVLAANAGTTVSAATVILISGDSSGSFATIAGGFGNSAGKTASAQYSAVIGGRSNDAEADYAAILGGRGNSVTAQYATAGGFDAAAGHYGSIAHASGQFGSQGDNQWELVHLWRQLVNLTTATELRLDGSGTRLLIANNNTAWMYKGDVLAKQTGGTTVNSWRIEGLIVMGTGAASAALKWSTIDTLWADATTASIAVTADTANGALSVKFTDSGGGAVTWDVGADIQIRQVAG